MTSDLGIAGVSAAIRNLLRDGLINRGVAAMLGSPITVSVGPPDKVVVAGGTEASQLNLFLYRVTPNTGWMSSELGDSALALDLHYLVSAYGGADLHGEILLGYAMQLLHENPVLTSNAVENALNSELEPGNTGLPALAGLGQENQEVLIRITPEHLSFEETSVLWTATMSPLRPSAAIVASLRISGDIQAPG